MEGKKESPVVSDFTEKSGTDGTQRTVGQRMCVRHAGRRVGSSGNYHLVKSVILM